MSELTTEQIHHVLSSDKSYYLVKLLEAKGSTPRNAGAVMIVGPDDIFGTIGGGSAEWVAVQSVRSFIDGAAFRAEETITLGPEIDQCCGGVLEVSYQEITPALEQELPGLVQKDKQTDVLIFGAGHTGLALANALLLLNVNIHLIDTRSEYAGKTGPHEFLNLAVPEQAVRDAQPGSVFVITTHDHSLDFLITSEALERGDAAYVGMIGSPTKRAVLKSWMNEHQYNIDDFSSLHCPIGGSKVRNKQPEVIAAMTVAEILTAIEAQDIT